MVSIANVTHIDVRLTLRESQFHSVIIQTNFLPSFNKSCQVLTDCRINILQCQNDILLMPPAEKQLFS
jgi:hypothetical protein